MITSAALTASATSMTRRPASSASARLFEPGGQPDDDVHPGFVEVERVGVALAAVADDRHGLPGQGRRVGVVVVVHPRGHRLIASSMDPEPRAITTAPVRTNSLMP